MSCRRRANAHGSENHSDKPAAAGPVFPSVTRGGPAAHRGPVASPQQAELRAGKVEVMSGEMTPLRIVSTAEELIGIRDGGDAGLWPKTAAVLWRQIILLHPGRCPG